MAITQHVTTRIYGQVFGTPPFQNAAGQAAFSNTKPFTVAPNASIALTGAHIWSLSNGVQMGPNNFYVYSVIELPPAGLNQPSVKLASDQSVTTLTTNAT